MKRPKRPRDPAQLAKLMVDIAVGEVDDREPDARHKISKGRLKIMPIQSRSSRCITISFASIAPCA